MGDPKKPKKQYQTPMHPWQRERIEEERRLVREYGLKNKKEVWKHNTQIKRLLGKFKDVSISNPDQAKKEKDELLSKMVRIGVIKHGADDDHILGLGVKDILERRLQTVVYKKKLANSVTQARQFIVHRHIAVKGRVVTSPSYLVTLGEQDALSFVSRSPLFNEEHPERMTLGTSEESKKKQKREKSATAPPAPVDTEAVPEPEEVVIIDDEDSGDETTESTVTQSAPKQDKEEQQ